MTYKRNSASPSSKSPKSPVEEVLQLHCKHVLKNQIFIASYEQRRFIDSLQEYRDMVLIKNTETELKKILDDIVYRLKIYYENENMWIGIENFIIWTEIKELAFGEYWFQVKSIKFRNNEITLKLKMLRRYDQPTNNTNFNNKTENEATINDNSFDENIQAMKLNLTFLYELLISWRNGIEQSITTFLAHDLNRENLITGLKFIMLLLLSLVTAGIEAIAFLGKFTIRFITEFRLLLRTSTPILLKMLELFSKLIGGLYILFAMIWRDLIGGIFGRTKYMPRQNDNSKMLTYNQNWERRNYREY